MNLPSNDIPENGHENPPPTHVLGPLSQHLHLTRWLRDSEKEVWQWFADKERDQSDAEQMRLALLRDTYRLDAESHPEVFREISAACAALFR